MIDPTGLELVARAVRGAVGEGSVRETIHHHGEATLDVRPDDVHEVIRFLHDDADEPFDFLSSLHGCDYFPAEPRLAVHYQLLSTERGERLGVRTRMTVEVAESGEVPTVIDLFPTASFQEKEVFDFFGVRFAGHEDLRRLHMPEDYEGHPQRRDYPIGGEPVLFTYNEHEVPRWYE
ncbi:MAG TPA: NADH-quinone oxidoreductase subunit C [Thermoleophilaceae bacterium]|nr:NADH-quinone oxidoreductase subunit C [Thermoleophilaceae bacterium]